MESGGFLGCTRIKQEITYNSCYNTRMLPQSLQRLLWSYDIKKLDINRDVKAIVNAVLVYGDLPDMKTLLSIYDRKDVKQYAEEFLKKDSWNKKSYTFWATVL
jgi:hypothetical protein